MAKWSVGFSVSSSLLESFSEADSSSSEASCWSYASFSLEPSISSEVTTPNGCLFLSFWSLNRHCLDLSMSYRLQLLQKQTQKEQVGFDIVMLACLKICSLFFSTFYGFLRSHYFRYFVLPKHNMFHSWMPKNFKIKKLMSRQFGQVTFVSFVHLRASLLSARVHFERFPTALEAITFRGNLLSGG